MITRRNGLETRRPVRVGGALRVVAIIAFMSPVGA